MGIHVGQRITGTPHTVVSIYDFCEKDFWGIVRFEQLFFVFLGWPFLLVWPKLEFTKGTFHPAETIKINIFCLVLCYWVVLFAFFCFDFFPLGVFVAKGKAVVLKLYETCHKVAKRCGQCWWVPSQLWRRGIQVKPTSHMLTLCGHERDILSHLALYHYCHWKMCLMQEKLKLVFFALILTFYVAI